MKSLSYFKILIRYFKEDKLKFFLYIILTVLKHFEPLLNAFIWANAFQAIADGNKYEFIKYLILWSSFITIAWVCIQVPTDLLYNSLEKKVYEECQQRFICKSNRYACNCI